LKFLILNADYPEFLHWLYHQGESPWSMLPAEETHSDQNRGP